MLDIFCYNLISVILFQISIFLTVISSAFADETLCPENGCSNLTFFLGPKWGSKQIQYPNYPKFRGPSEEETKMTNTSRIRNKSQVIKDDSLNIEGSADMISPHHRPVPDDNSFDIDYNDMPQSQVLPSVNRSISYLKTHNLSELIVEGTLNLTNLGLQGKCTFFQ